MHLTVICDERTKEDRSLGESANRGWNERPYYLINKILKDPRFQPNYATLDELALMPVSSGAAILHLDQTIHSEEIVKCIDNLIPKDARILNRRIIDISKRHIEDVFVSMGGLELSTQKDDSYEGLVIVKSNFNAGDAMRREYKILKKEEANEIFNDLDMVVQRFASSTKSKNDLRRMDRYIVFMNEIVYCSFFSEEDVIKRDTSIWQYYRNIKNLRRDFKANRKICLNEQGVYYKELSSLECSNEQTVVELCRLLGLDFGSIDTITDSEGNFYVLDINKTTWERGIPEHFLAIFRNKLLEMEEIN